MTRMTPDERIHAFTELGEILNELLRGELHHPLSNKFKERFDTDTEVAFHHNGWFDKPSVDKALTHLLPWLTTDALKAWTSPYLKTFSPESPKTIGIIMAGNIPLIGFHDLLSVLISGNRVLGKTSSKDPLLPKLVLDILKAIEPRFTDFIELTNDRFSAIDAVIATGSNNSMRYFEHYFGKYPHILRGNRNSIAVLNGSETKEELKALGEDIFTFYGLGCRNVTNLIVPSGYDFSNFFEAIEPLNAVIQNKKYANNYEYNRTVWLLNSEQGLLDNNFLIIKPQETIGSPIGTLFYQFYDSSSEVADMIHREDRNIQCVVGKEYLPFGVAQQPGLEDYPDKVNVLDFISSLD